MWHRCRHTANNINPLPLQLLCGNIRSNFRDILYPGKTRHRITLLSQINLRSFTVQKLPVQSSLAKLYSPLCQGNNCSGNIDERIHYRRLAASVIRKISLRRSKEKIIHLSGMQWPRAHLIIHKLSYGKNKPSKKRLHFSTMCNPFFEGLQNRYDSKR